MTNKTQHHNEQPVFSRQSHTNIEQILPTSGLVASAQRTNGNHPARQPRFNPLNVDSDISRVSARLPADRIGEWSHHPTHTDRRPATSFQTRPDAVPTHIRPSQSNRQKDPHQRQVVTLMHFDITKTGESRPRIQRPDTGTNPHASRSTNRGELPIDPDNSRKAFTHAEQPRGGVRQDKGFLTKALSASQEPAPLTKGGRAGVVNKDSPRSQNAPRPQTLSNARMKLVHTTFWLHPLVRAELERIAQCERLTLSQIGAIGLDQWVRTRLHQQHEALLYPVLRQLIRDELRAFGNRIVFFLMRIAFAAEQTRILTTNLLNRYLKQNSVPDETFNNLVDSSNKMARRNIIARSPEIKTLMKEWEASHENDKRNTNGKEENPQ